MGNVEAGERYSFKEADISDWMFMRNGKIVGNETMRPLLKRMPKAEAARYRAMLESPKGLKFEGVDKAVRGGQFSACSFAAISLMKRLCHDVTERRRRRPHPGKGP